ncbi:hypothetical protein PAV_141p00250 (plasmid) [Paenibacillus alvei DSM 29]|uniref:DNA polymerase beta superfamily protein n=1 Tax=Paenibacillus alvei TaxID=44250 RepID=UPI0002894BE9|nr:nucleotidyltransferase domain-containing protein [Paenibacillus alvei]EJW13919.1 hypothetical protein PAV_141p00250 [Paenibacillus alvei DSM 29]
MPIILKEQAEILEASGYTVAFIGIYGSQNYGLDLHTEEYQSDIDMKAIIVPTLDNLIRNSKPVSTVVDTKWGQCDVKDIRVFFGTLLKANPSFIEILYTDYYYVNPKFEVEFNQILSLRDELMEALSPQFMKAMYGMMCEKAKAMCHPYPSIAHKIEKYGYDGKQLSHAYRLLVMIDEYFNKKKPLKECFCPSGHTKGIIIEFKLNKIPLEIAKERIDVFLEDGKKERDKYLSSVDISKIDFSIKDRFLMLSQEIIKNKIIEEVQRGR